MSGYYQIRPKHRVQEVTEVIDPEICEANNTTVITDRLKISGVEREATVRILKPCSNNPLSCGIDIGGRRLSLATALSVGESWMIS